MIVKKKLAKHLLIFLFTYSLLIFYSMPSYAAETSEKQILILNSYHKDVVWSDDVMSGIKTSLKSSNIKFSAHTEYMDTKIFFDDKYLNSLYEFYKSKYENKKFDIIIASDNVAFSFLSTYSDKLFPNTPVVFCGVNYFEDSMIENNKLFTGVVEDIPLKETLDVALKLHPKTKNIIFIVSTSPTGLATRAALQDILPTYSGRNFNYIFTENLDFIEDKDTFKELSKDSVALLLSGYITNYQDTIMTEKDGSFTLKGFPIPTYISWDFFLNRGAIGGKILSGKSHGEIAGNLAVQILKGKKPSDIPVIKKNESKYIFDYKQLVKFSINNDNLPIGSTLINLPSRSYTIDKELIWFAIMLIVILCSFLALNISQRHEAKLALIENEERLRTLIDASPNLICLKDSNGRWLDANKAALEFFNLNSKSWEMKTDKELLKIDNVFKDGLQKYNSFDNVAFKESHVIKHTEVFQRENEEDRIYEILKIPIINSKNNVKSLATIGLDITTHIKAQEDKRLLNELVEYENLRTEFFANISHELKTPINVILSALQYVELIHHKESKVDNSHTFIKYISTMKQNCYRLVRIVNNLIDITKIDAGYFELALENYNIVEVVEEISLSVVSYAESNGLSLTFDTDIEEKILACDANIIERVLLNLISNSIKFTDSGGHICINIYDKENLVQISVKDTGIGISKDKHQFIFDRFIQADKSLSRNREGSGIGLSLVKSLVEMHRGSIKLISEPNKGSEFIVTLPVYLIPNKEVKLYSNTLKYASNDEKANIEFSDIY